MLQTTVILYSAAITHIIQANQSLLIPICHYITISIAIVVIIVIVIRHLDQITGGTTADVIVYGLNHAVVVVMVHWVNWDAVLLLLMTIQRVSI